MDFSHNETKPFQISTISIMDDNPSSLKSRGWFRTLRYRICYILIQYLLHFEQYLLHFDTVFATHIYSIRVGVIKIERISYGRSKSLRHSDTSFFDKITNSTSNKMVYHRLWPFIKIL